MLVGSTPAHRPLRLLREYRGNRPGAIIAATPGLAVRLVADGIAEHAEAAEAVRAVPERAVGPTASVEVRS